MMMIRLFFLSIILSSLMLACRSTRKIQTAIGKKDSVQAVAIPKPAAEDSAAVVRQTIEKMQSGLVNFNTFSAKINVDYQGTDGKKYDVNANLRMYKDSVIWISITAILGIEGLRAYITKDSVKLLNKQDKVYTARSVAYLQEVTALPLDLHTLQQILIGNPVFLDSNISSYSRSGNNISLLSNGEWFRNLLTLNEAGRIENSKLDDVEVNRSRTCNLSYADYENKKGVLFSTRRRITVSEKSNLDIKLDFKSYDFNETLSFPFTVPKNYKRN
jgi:outer membrane biogenesis lipoprotein LolB